MRRKRMRWTVFGLTVLAIMLADHRRGPAVAGTPTPNVAGTWQGTWTHAISSDQITLRLDQEGAKVTGKQSVVGVVPVFGPEQEISLGEGIEGGQLEESTLCGFTCGKVRVKKSSM